MEIHPKVQEYLGTIDLASNDHRLEFNKEAKICYWFHTFLDNELTQLGRCWVGCVFRQREEQCLLVVKTRTADIQEVVYVTERTPIGCMRVFCRKFYADTLQWRPDRYA